MGEREGACARATGVNECGVSEECKEGSGGWSTEGEKETCPIRQERKEWADPEACGRVRGAVGESGGGDV